MVVGARGTLAFEARVFVSMRRIGKLLFTGVILIVCYTFLPWKPKIFNNNAAFENVQEYSGSRNDKILRTYPENKTHRQTDTQVTHARHMNLIQVTPEQFTNISAYFKDNKTDTVQSNRYILKEEKKRIFKEISFERDRTFYRVEDKEGRWKENLSEIVTSKNGWKIPNGLYRIAKPVFDTVPHSYLKDFKNPCWYMNGTLRCLPYFYQAGMAKCGSTDVWSKISGHPQIVTAEKEYHWWNLHRFKMAKEDEGFSEYLSKAITTLSRSPRKAELVIGDGTPATLWDNFCLQEFRYQAHVIADLPYITPDIIHAIQPNAKFIVVVREPISSSRSAYQAFNKGVLSAKEFHDRVVLTINYFNNCFKEYGVRVCVENRIKKANLSYIYAYMKQGFVPIYLKVWFQLYPREQFKIVELGNWKNNCTSILADIYKFLELDPVSERKLLESCNRPAKNKNRRHIEILPETKKIMQEFYRPFNEMLYDLLGDRRFLWQYL